jgi:hypothetical protein
MKKLLFILSALTVIAASANAAELTKGQSAVLCISGASASMATFNLNYVLTNGPVMATSAHATDKVLSLDLITVNAPFQVSAPTYVMEKNPEFYNACVTITKQ